MKNNYTIAVLGGHSALDVCAGAKKHGFKTLAVCQKGREKTYAEYYKTRDGRGCVDEVLLVDKFADITGKDVNGVDVQSQLISKNAIFIHNRYFWVYCNFNDIEDKQKFKVPIYGNRRYVKFEERNIGKNQYWLLNQAKIKTPKVIRDGLVGFYNEKDLRKVLDDHFVINKGGPLIVKENEALRTYERAFFIINSEQDYFDIGSRMVKNGVINEETLNSALIEEFIIGAQVNFNFFYSTINKRLELMGTDARRQTSIDGFLRLDAERQLELLRKGYRPSMIETGHYSVTIKESLIEKAYEIGEKFVKATEKHYGQKMIGPFALQGAVSSENGREELVIFDVSMRIPGSPGTRFTPYTGYLWGDQMSYGERIAIEIKEAIEQKRLYEILT